MVAEIDKQNAYNDRVNKKRKKLYDIDTPLLVEAQKNELSQHKQMKTAFESLRGLNAKRLELQSLPKRDKSGI